MDSNVIDNKPFYLQVSHYAVHASLQMQESLKNIKFQKKANIKIMKD